MSDAADGAARKGKLKRLKQVQLETQQRSPLSGWEEKFRAEGIRGGKNQKGSAGLESCAGRGDCRKSRYLLEDFRDGRGETGGSRERS